MLAKKPLMLLQISFVACCVHCLENHTKSNQMVDFFRDIFANGVLIWRFNSFADKWFKPSEKIITVVAFPGNQQKVPYMGRGRDRD